MSHDLECKLRALRCNPWWICLRSAPPMLILAHNYRQAPRQSFRSGPSSLEKRVALGWKLLDVALAGAAEVDRPPAGDRDEVADAAGLQDLPAERAIADAAGLD